MKRIIAILLLFSFGSYIFAYKTHYCFYPDGGRYHGDCEPELHQELNEYASLDESLPDTIFPEHFDCYNFHKNTIQSKQELTSICHSDTQFLPAYCIARLRPGTAAIRFISIPVFSCRGGPPLLPNSLRAPPPAC